MSSLVSQSMNRSQGAKTPKAADSSAKKKSLQALAMEKAKKSSPTPAKKAPAPAPITTGVSSVRRNASEERRGASPVRPAVASTRTTKVPTMPAYAPAYSTPPSKRSAQMVETPFHDARDEEEVLDPVVTSRERGLKARSEEKKSSRTRSVSRSTEPKADPIATVNRTVNSNVNKVRSYLLRLIVAVACAVTLYAIQSRISPELQLPSSLARLQLEGNTEGNIKLYLDSKASSDADREDIRKFKSGLVEALKDRYSDNLSVEQLWETYLQMKKTNGQMFAAMGMLVGFVVGGIFM